ncbi:MAG: hypothetical protein KA902_04275 [Arenimonas sp.]|nr:hypothetical protein [Arenimonas sp.]
MRTSTCPYYALGIALLNPTYILNSYNEYNNFLHQKSLESRKLNYALGIASLNPTYKYIVIN